ncbi:MAG TPA: hypothetical protein VK152_06680 [Paludibacter sp.]|nr:hypothetical protein [Paludibacter sp.]
MIVKETNNIPVSAAQIQDMNAALVLFRTFRNEPGYQMSHLVTFLSEPSAERDAFYDLFTSEIVVIKSRYANHYLTLP